MVKTSIIIPNFNGAQKTLRLISELYSESSPKREIVVVDDGSTDCSYVFIKESINDLRNVRVVKQTNKGRSAARNTGAKVANGDFLVFIDNDIITNPGFLNRIEYIHDLKPRAWITGGVSQDIINCPHKDFLIFRQRLDFTVSRENADSFGLVHVNSFTTQQLGVSKSEFTKAGGFDEALRDCEDFELSVRVWKVGGLIVHDTQNTVRHADYADMKDFVRRQMEYRHGRARLGQLKPEIVNLFPELFLDSRDIPLCKRLIRRFFRFNKVWDYALNMSIIRFFPKSMRFFLYDLIISSTYLFTEVRDEV
jgi:GT2 family glycosyltransferase